MRDSHRVNLEWVQQRIENLFGSMEGIYNNNYIIDISDTNCLVNTILNGKQFSFSSCNVNCFVNCLDDRSVIWMNVRDWRSYIVLDTGIEYNNGRERVRQCSEYNIIQVFDVILDIRKMWMEIKSIWKRIDEMISWIELLVKKRKEGISLLHLLFKSMRVDFKRSFCLEVRLLMEMLWELCSCNLSELRILLII